MLQAEIDRIARDTKKPELIQEIWEALVNNPYLVAECFARPLLIDRLTRNWYAFDSRFHSELKAKAEGELSSYSIYNLRSMSGDYSEIHYFLDNNNHSLALKKNTNIDRIYVTEEEFKEIESTLEQSGSLQEDEHQFYITRFKNNRTGQIDVEYMVWKKVPFE